MCYLADEGTHGDSPGHSEGLEGLDQLHDEPLPAVMRLLAHHHHEVSLRAPHGVDLVTRPGDLPDPLGVEGHHGASHLEIEVLVRIDDGYQLAAESFDEGPRGLAGRLAGVAPALEGDEGNRVAEHRPLQPF